MIKNLMIIFLMYLIGILLFGSPIDSENLKKRAFEAKEFIWKRLNCLDGSVNTFTKRKFESSFFYEKIV